MKRLILRVGYTPEKASDLTMHGEELLVRTLSQPSVEDKDGNLWQYHSRSDRHSKIACWGFLFDLLNSCELLRRHARAGKVAFGINHEMTDFVSQKKKNLDLVICVPAQGEADGTSFASLAADYGVALSADERQLLAALPALPMAKASDVLVALEAKACMTAHTKATPRLYDELSSAAQCINGSATNAIAVALVLINAAEVFVSSDKNRGPLNGKEKVLSKDPQPRSANKALSCVRQLKVRGQSTQNGYDAVCATVILAKNDGSSIQLAAPPLGITPPDSLAYELTVRRVASIYESRFQAR